MRTTMKLMLYMLLGFVSGYLIYRYFISEERPYIPAAKPVPPAPRTAPPPAAPQVRQAPPAAPAAADDLTRIKGIGPTFAGRLQAAGVRSFQDLVNRSDEELREITRIRDWQRPGVEDWREEARDFLR